MAALLLPRGESAPEVYADLQRRLDAMPSLVVKTHPHGSDEDRGDVEYRVLRPDKASVTGGLYRWRTDGKRTVRNDSEGRFNRSAKPDDIRKAALLGFESFIPTKKRPIPVGQVRPFVRYGGKCLAIDLECPGEGRKVLFLDAATRLPVGYGEPTEEVDDIVTDYTLTLDASLSSASFDVTAPQPASTVYGHLRKRLQDVHSFSLRIDSNGGSILAMRPDCYFRTDGRGKLLKNGDVLSRHPKGQTAVVSKSKAWPPEFIPGLEAFFGNKPIAQVSGIAEVAFLDSGEAYILRAIYPGQGEYKLYVDIRTGLISGYNRIVKGKPTLARRFQGIQVDRRNLSRAQFAFPPTP
ncbi:hypothetical protein EON81_17515 [bacterium]|nr:MAG: hypothetical protein EON81_17515 [bacterium]